MIRLIPISLAFVLSLTVLCAHGVTQQRSGAGAPTPVDNEYTGDFMHFGVTNNYAELMPFACPIGTEHLQIENQLCGYTLSYKIGTSSYIAYATFEEHYHMTHCTYAEEVNPLEIRIRTANQTTNGILGLYQNFTFRMDGKFILLESWVCNQSANTLDSVIYKITADWDVDSDWNDDEWGFDALNQMPYAYDLHYCTLYPVFPPPTIIDYDGFDDCYTRATTTNAPPSSYTNYDGCEIMHYDLGDLEPGQSAYIAVIFASEDSLGGLGRQIYEASSYLAIPGVLQGYVYNMNLEPLANSVISNSFYGLSDTTNADGYYQLDQVPPGTHLFTTEHEGYYDTSILIHVAPGDTTAQDFYLEQVITTMLVLELFPHGTPIIIPGSGGSFSFTASVQNTYPDPQVVDLWTYLLLPGSGMVGPILQVENLTLPSNSTQAKDYLQAVPVTAPPGTYQYWACVGNYPWVVFDSDSFTFEKAGVTGIEGNWSLADWVCDDGLFRFSSISPNPFNAATVLSFELRAASFVKLEVFDVKGRLVSGSGATPTMYGAGIHQITFDGSGLPSGIYFYRLEAGAEVASGKMVLLK